MAQHFGECSSDAQWGNTNQKKENIFSYKILGQMGRWDIFTQTTLPNITIIVLYSKNKNKTENDTYLCLSNFRPGNYHDMSG